MDRRSLLKLIAAQAAVAPFLRAGLASAEPTNDYVIGLMYGRTGPYVTSSRTTEIAVDIAAGEINAAGGILGRKLRIAKFDTGGDPRQAALAVQQFARDDGAICLIGPFSSSEARLTFPAGDREKISQISNSSTAPGLTKGFKFPFRLTQSEDVQFGKLLSVIKDKNLPHASASDIYVNDDTIEKDAGEKIFPPAFKAADIPLLQPPVGFPLATFDLSPYVAQLMQKQADLVAVGGTVEAAVKVIVEMKRQGHRGRPITSGLWADPSVPIKLGKDGNGALYVSWFYPDANPKAKAFAAKFVAATKKAGIAKPEPHHVDASAYDAVYMIAQAIGEGKFAASSASMAADRVGMRDTLAKIQFDGAIGHTYFNAEHDAVLPAYAIEIEDGSTKLLGERAAGK